MSEAPPPLDLPPLNLPPDQGKRSAPRFAAFVLSFLVAMVLGVLAVVSLLKEPADLRDLAASSGPIPSSLPVATPTPPPALPPPSGLGRPPPALPRRRSRSRLPLLRRRSRRPRPRSGRGSTGRSAS